MGWTLVNVCVCRFVNFHTYRPATEWQMMRWNVKKWQKFWSTFRWVELYWKGGELGSTVASPSDEDDKSAGFSAGGGVRGTKSGLSDCTPENRIKRAKTRILPSVTDAEEVCNNRLDWNKNPRTVVWRHFLPPSASDSVLLKWLWQTSLESKPGWPVACDSGVGPPRVGALRRPPWPPPRLFFEGEGLTGNEVHANKINDHRGEPGVLDVRRTYGGFSWTQCCTWTAENGQHRNRVCALKRCPADRKTLFMPT